MPSAQTLEGVSQSRRKNWGAGAGRNRDTRLTRPRGGSGPEQNSGYPHKNYLRRPAGPPTERPQDKPRSGEVAHPADQPACWPRKWTSWLCKEQGPEGGQDGLRLTAGQQWRLQKTEHAGWDVPRVPVPAWLVMAGRGGKRGNSSLGEQEPQRTLRRVCWNQFPAIASPQLSTNACSVPRNPLGLLLR